MNRSIKANSLSQTNKDKTLVPNNPDDSSKIVLDKATEHIQNKAPKDGVDSKKLNDNKGNTASVINKVPFTTSVGSTQETKTSSTKVSNNVLDFIDNTGIFKPAKDKTVTTEALNGTGLDNTWNNKADSYAETLYQQSKNTSEAEYATKAAELATSRAESQTEIEMKKYVNSQTIDKLGWTGGYTADQTRQLETLKAGIQAQLYNQQELNRLGLESQLTAARMSADLKNQELAHNYYIQAEQQNVRIAELTGYYLPAVASDYLTQRSAAEQTLASNFATQEEKERAKKVISYVTSYFAENNLSEAGQKTLSYIDAETRLLDAERKTNLEIAANLRAQRENSEDVNMGRASFTYDKDGNIAVEPNDEYTYSKVYFESIKNEELKDLLKTNEKNSFIIEKAAQYKLDTIANRYQIYLDNNSLEPSADSWNDFANNIGKAFIDNYQTTLSDIDTKLYGEAFSTVDTDKGTFTVSVSDNGELKVVASKNIQNENSKK